MAAISLDLPIFQPQIKKSSFRSHFRTLSPSHTPAFVYQYVVEDGKTPFLAETWPLNKNESPQSIHPILPGRQTSVDDGIVSQVPSIPQNTQLSKSPQASHVSQSHRALQTSHSNDHAIDKLLNFELPTMQDFGIDTSKLKRALSLSGGKSKGHTRNTSRNLQPITTSMISAPIPHPGLEYTPATVTPTLLLPPVSPVSPTSNTSNASNTLNVPYQQDVRISLHSDSTRSSSTGIGSSFSHPSSRPHPHSSWASSTNEEDMLDLQFIRDVAQGKFSSNSSNSTLHYGVKRNKAFQVLGIPGPITPPYTPSGSPSINESTSRLNSRFNSRRPSMEQHQNIHQLSKDDASWPMFPSAQPYYPKSSAPSRSFTPPQQVIPTLSTIPATPTANSRRSEHFEEQTPRPQQHSSLARQNSCPEPRRRQDLAPPSKFTEHLNDTPILQAASFMAIHSSLMTAASSSSSSPSMNISQLHMPPPPLNLQLPPPFQLQLPPILQRQPQLTFQTQHEQQPESKQIQIQEETQEQGQELQQQQQEIGIELELQAQTDQEQEQEKEKEQDQEQEQDSLQLPLQKFQSTDSLPSMAADQDMNSLLVPDSDSRRCSTTSSIQLYQSASANVCTAETKAVVAVGSARLII